MTSELRPAVEVVHEIGGLHCFLDALGVGMEGTNPHDDAVAIIEADREAVRAEQTAELAKFKALAETLTGALERIALGFTIELDDEDGPVNVWLDAEELSDLAREALRQYKEARDDKEMA